MRSLVHGLPQKDQDLGTYLGNRAVSIIPHKPSPYLGNLRPNILGTHDSRQSLVGGPREA
jgi:hypothetical protein